MEYRKFGKTDLQVSVLGMGCAPLGSRTDRKTSIDSLNQSFDLGINFYDTAPFYGQGESEKLIGETFKGRREQVIVTTKVGMNPTATLQLAAKIKPLVRSTLEFLPIPSVKRYLQGSVQSFIHANAKTEFDTKSIVQSVEASLRRLHSDYIDLLLLHITPQRDQISEVVEILKALKQQGKIRYYGASTHGLEDTLMWLKTPETEISALQVRLNLFELKTIDLCLPIAQQKGIAVIAREPFALGKLLPSTSLQPDRGVSFSGSYKFDERFNFLTDTNLRTIPQAALQFLLQTEGISVILAGMSKPEHVRQNATAIDKPKLTLDDLQKIRTIVKGRI